MISHKIRIYVYAAELNFTALHIAKSASKIREQEFTRTYFVTE